MGVGADIAVALTNEIVEVDTSFSGAKLTLFGAVSGIEDEDGDGSLDGVDIIAVVKGPQTSFNIRRLEKHAVIWMPGQSHKVASAPSLYVTAATKPIDQIAALETQTTHHLQADFLPLQLQLTDEMEGNLEFQSILRSAFLREVQALGLYQTSVGAVQFQKQGLFTINIDLPSTTPVGSYSVSVLLFIDGVLVGDDETMLDVNKVGIERHIFESAHNRPVSYGIACVALSLLAGWIAGVVFRK